MPSTSPERVLIIKGLDCAGCARTVEAGVARLAGVEHCELTFSSERLRVVGPVAYEAVVQRVRELGYTVAEPSAEPVEAAVAVPPPANFLSFLWSRTETRLALLGAVLVLPGLISSELLGQTSLWASALALLALVLTGWPIARSAWRSLLLSRELTINALMTVAAVGAVVIGAYVEAGMVMVLFAIGEALEGYTSDRARQAIRSLMQVVPQTALRLHTSCGDAGCEERVPVGELRVGDVIIVRPGERLPMDGIVRSGASALNQAPITGESSLVEKRPGDELFAGSINGEGSLEVEVTRLATDTTISRMIRLVEAAQERRAPVQRIVDRFSRWYTPAVVALAALVALLPPLFGQPFWNPTPDEFGWFYRGLALLVVACPCALVISTPASLVSAMSAAARNGVLVKGGACLEALSKVRVIAFDKTGTLTAGRPAVVAVRGAACADSALEPPGRCASCDEVLALAGAVERRSEHPLAHAIVSASADRGLDRRYPAAESVTALTGRGVAGLVGGREVLVGSHGYFDASIPHTLQHCEAAAHDAGAGYTPLFVSAGGTYMGMITVADTVRETSREAVLRLKALGLQAVVMLTGDQRRTAERIAATVGVTDVRAELLPAQKVAAVEALEREYGPVAMVGDGINDTPALAVASVGIAISGADGGSSQAMETADITLMSDDLRRLPFVLGLSRAAMRTVSTNIMLSISIKLIFIVLVLFGLGTMWMAVLADMGTSLLVTLNGMRLLGYRER